MTSPKESGAPPRVKLADIRPFVSLLVLHIEDAAAPDQLFEALVRRAMGRRQAPGTSVGVVASGLEEQALTWAGVRFDEGAATVWRRQRQAPWASDSSRFTDVEHELFVCLRRGPLVAVMGPDSVRRAIETWMDRPPRPQIHRVKPGVLNASLLGGGEAKTMWLRNVRGSTASRPDSKTLSGIDLATALDPIGDGSFSLGAARVAIPEDESRSTFTGTVGTAPRKSRVWSRPTGDAAEFLIAVDEVLQMVQTAIDGGADLITPFETLSSPVDGLAGVHGAYEFRCPLAVDLAAQDATPEQVASALALEAATIDTRPIPGSADAILSVGYNGTTAGSLRVAVSEEGSDIRVAIGHEGEGTDPSALVDIRDKIRQVGDWSIHYMSGHAVMGRTVYQVRQETAAFTGWRFANMDGFRIDVEKPKGGNPQETHAAIGEDGDDSLFGWIASTYERGSLLCDDGPGEIADFLHIDDNGTFSLIHVKAAGGASHLRRVAVAPYEVVVSQAVKNLRNLIVDHLAERLGQSPVADPAAWSQGTRVAGRGDFLDSLACREAVDPLAVVVIQPHITQSKHQEIRSMPTSANDPDLYRLRLLDTLLNTALMSCIGSNAGFTVVGAA